MTGGDYGSLTPWKLVEMGSSYYIGSINNNADRIEVIMVNEVEVGACRLHRLALIHINRLPTGRISRHAIRAWRSRRHICRTTRGWVYFGLPHDCL